MKPEKFDIFFITGQSNASGARDSATDPETERENAVVPPEGTSYCLDVNSRNERGEIYDLNRGRSGIAPALALRWHELTGRGCFIVQTAVSGSPIQRWTFGESRLASTGKNFLDNTLDAADYVLSLGQAGTGEFNFGDIYYIWCQGETGQAHEWNGQHWIMPGVKLIDTDSYYKRFENYHEVFTSRVNIKLGAIMLVRTLPRKSSKKSLELGLLTDMVPSKQAQYTAHACHGKDLRIMSRICDIARMETTPGPGAGYLKGDNVHYKKKGYNAQARELADNIFKFVSADTDRTPRSLEWIGPDGRTPMKNGEILPVDCVKGAMTAAVVLPLWADDPSLKFSTVPGKENGCTIDRYGKITFKPGTPLGTRSELIVTAGCGFQKKIIAECAPEAPADEVDSGIVTDFIWNFSGGNLSEYNGYNDLQASADSYEIHPDGIRIISGSLTPEKTIHTSNNYDWKIHWRASFDSQTRIVSGYQARIDSRVTSATGFCVRFVTSENKVFELPYSPDGDYEDLTIEFFSERDMLRLSSENRIITELTTEKTLFSASFNSFLNPTSGVFSLLEVHAFVEQNNS